jgi:nitrite reductase (NO-forming)
MDPTEVHTSRRSSESGWWVTTFVVSVLALIAAVIAVVAANSDSTTATAAAGDTGKTEYDIVLADLSITPKNILVPAGATITLHVENKGAMAHDLKVLGTSGTEMLAPGEKVTVTVGPFTASTQAWCTVPGHKEAGMLMDITVAGATDHGTDHGTTTGSTGSTGSTGDFATIDAAAAPADDWQARDPVLAPALTGTVHEIALDATEELVEVSPGVTQMMWTFNGEVPGPTLRGKVGDTFRITLTNKGTLGHSIDFHASKVAWSDEMRTIQPGESLVYEFTAEFAGAFMYHCGTAPALHHIGNGMFGAIIIDPPNLAPVDEEFLVVQSELYLGPEGQPGDLTKMLNEDWDAVVFNGYHNQYKHRPIHVEANTRYRVWVVDDGPSENSAFHIVGTVFDTVWKEGAYLLQPDATHGGSQVLDLQPAQGGFVEFTFAEDGLYPFVTHKFANASKGALGFFAVGDVDTSALGGH